MEMRKLVVGLALVAIALIAAPAMAEEGTFTSDGDVRLRYDYMSNYLDANDDGATNDSYDLWPYRARLGVNGHITDRVWGRVELQAAGWFGDSSSSTSYPFPGSPGGMIGATGPSSGDIDLYQAFVTVEGGTWDFTAGRREHTIGNELQLGDNDFYNGQIFDGLTASGDYSSVDLNVWWHELAETGALREDTWLAGIDADIDVLGGLRPYIIYAKSFGNGIPATAGGDLNLWTFGIQWEKPVNEEQKGWDLNIEIAGQTGDGYGGLAAGPPPVPNTSDGVDFGGFIVESWFGWSFGGAGRIHIGYLLASGDDGTDPGSNDAWRSLFPDPHANNRLGNLDLFAGFANAADPFGRGMSNIQDISLGYDWSRGNNHALIAIHNFTRPEVLTGADDDIGMELDLAYEHDYAENASFVLGISTLFAGDALKPTPTTDADNISRVYAQLHFDWGK
jgi:hypothetical protein